MEKGSKNHRETLYSSKGKIVYVVGKPCNIYRLQEKHDMFIVLSSGKLHNSCYFLQIKGFEAFLAFKICRSEDLFTKYLVKCFQKNNL